MLGTVYSLIRRLKQSNFPGHGLVNQMYYDPEAIILRLESLDYVAVDSCKFHANDQIDSLQRIDGNPWFRNIRPDDVVLDIGANIGAIAIPLAKKAEHVYAVEPLFFKELRDNVELNGLINVTILPFGIAPTAGFRAFEFSSRSGGARTISFAELKEWTGHIDFLKMDCEGCEWGIESGEMEGIRELRIEFHIRRGHKRADQARLERWKQWLTDSNYTYTVDYGASPKPCVPFSDCVLVNASLESEKE